MFKKIVQFLLERYVKKYFKRHPEVRLIVVTGSVGKTTTKVAIGTVLSERLRVRLHEGNYNSEISTPLAVLGIDVPETLRSISGWLGVFKAARLRIKQPTDVDVIVQELGTDGVGQVPHAAKYLKPDIAVVTAVAPEHMEFFGSIEYVAQEELSVVNFSKEALINRDDIDGEYAKYITNANIATYGTSVEAEYRFVEDDYTLQSGYSGRMIIKDQSDLDDIHIHLLGDHSVRAAIAAAAVAVKLGLHPQEIRNGIAKIQAVDGRMSRLKGMLHSTIIDDTYNATPLAMASALQALYNLNVPQKIAVLGNMNELGKTSPKEHEALAGLCDPSQLSWLITVGSDMEQYLVPLAKKKGCQVMSFSNPLAAGAFVHKVLQPGAAVLFKGSEKDVYLEEAIKVILHSTEDENRLVRQSVDWMQRKKQFLETVL